MARVSYDGPTTRYGWVQGWGAISGCKARGLAGAPPQFRIGGPPPPARVATQGLSGHGPTEASLGTT